MKRLVEDGKFRPTYGATKDGHALNFSPTEMGDVILGLEPRDFYKSTNEKYNHSVWQDVYKKTVRGLRLYIKFKIFEHEGEYLLILSFKKDESAVM